MRLSQPIAPATHAPSLPAHSPSLAADPACAPHAAAQPSIAAAAAAAAAAALATALRRRVSAQKL